MDRPKFTDAKFKPVYAPRRWRLSFDWRNFLIVSAVAIMAGLSQLLGKH